MVTAEAQDISQQYAEPQEFQPSSAMIRFIREADALNFFCQYYKLPQDQIEKLRQEKEKKMELLPAPAAGDGGEEAEAISPRKLFIEAKAFLAYPTAPSLSAFVGETIAPDTAEDILYWLNEPTLDIWLRIWPVMLLLTQAGVPSLKVAAIGQAMLEKKGQGFNGLLRMHKVTASPEWHELATQEMPLLATVIESGLTLAVPLLHEVKQDYVGIAKAKFLTPEMTPRQRNGLNFWLEKGFFRVRDVVKELNERQHDILQLLVTEGTLSTGDLVFRYRVDRKTIQRDFAILVEYGVATIDGAGRNLRYSLSFYI